MSETAGTSFAANRHRTAEPALSTGIAGLILVLAAAMHLPMPVNHDAAWIILGAERILQGGAFGRDVIDVNPPLAWWITALPVAIAKAVGADPGTTFKLFVLALAALSVTLSRHLLVAAGLGGGELAALTGVTAALTCLAPGYDFGQREHLMVLLALPWLHLSIIRFDGAPARPTIVVASGLLAGIGICLKPFFLAIPLAIELTLLLVRRKPFLVFRPENLIIGGLGLAYVMAAYLTAPAYFSDILPAVMANYDAYDSGWGTTLRHMAIVLGPVGLGLLLAGLAPRRDAPGTPAIVFLSAAAGAFLAALAQKKGWPYHLYPALVFAALALSVLVIGLYRSGRRDNRLSMLVGALVVAFTIAKDPMNHLRDAAEERRRPRADRPDRTDHQGQLRIRPARASPSSLRPAP